MLDLLFAQAFTLWGAPTTWLEVIAVVLALAMVGCNIREIHWGWPLAAASSALYFLLFWRSKLYGDAGLQVFFALVALWGWYQWLRGVQPDGSALKVTRLPRRSVALAIVTCVVLWPLTAFFLMKFTDTDVPWWDGFPTAVSLVGQYLLGRKYIENWLVWIVVNVVSVGLFAYKGLWLTVGLYGVFIALSVVGWREWSKRA
ncbi:nicotinamide riboside transporter PnuC [Caenimonas koreensis]|uniref:Nicotinamide riboside transporter PnuC n=1 Tax=Caenimonas koreensis DSM 17982 TaxID=1121255 RepID=A0A844B2J3_9BURK|nr:nicotinamide riboside transporter PnuC [Caenimonas koreensis]MRD48958.1 nicotinamide riboside transporter PnuC [Caenimonas koreensis DSM 17982]